MIGDTIPLSSGARRRRDRWTAGDESIPASSLAPEASHDASDDLARSSPAPAVAVPMARASEAPPARSADRDRAPC